MGNVKGVPPASTLIYLINDSLPATVVQDILWQLSCTFVQSRHDYSLPEDHCDIYWTCDV